MRDRDQALGDGVGQADAELAQQTRSTAARPRKRTTFPIVPVCQPMTETVVPSPSPVYQPVRAETREQEAEEEGEPPSEPGHAARARERHPPTPAAWLRCPPSGEEYGLAPTGQTFTTTHAAQFLHFVRGQGRDQDLSPTRRRHRSIRRRCRPRVPSPPRSPRGTSTLASREALGGGPLLARSRARARGRGACSPRARSARSSGSSGCRR